MRADHSTVLLCAEHLRRIAADVREAGDVPLLRLSADGVTTEAITLSDELWLVAMRLDNRSSNDEPRPPDDTAPARCPECGAARPTDAPHCPACGARTGGSDG